MGRPAEVSLILRLAALLPFPPLSSLSTLTGPGILPYRPSFEILQLSPRSLIHARNSCLAISHSFTTYQLTAISTYA
jgi:hypothetical protein